MKTVGEKTARVDALALSRGKPVFTDDIKLNDVLHLKLLKSPFAHAKIVNIDVSQASEMEGVHAILTHKDFQPHYYTTAGQGYPEPSPRDMLIFDSVVRFVGDRVALVAADTIELAETSLEKIEVKYGFL